MSSAPVNCLGVLDQLVTVLAYKVFELHAAQVVPLEALVGPVGVLSDGQAALVPTNVTQGKVVGLGNARKASVGPTKIRKNKEVELQKHYLKTATLLESMIINWYTITKNICCSMPPSK